MGNDDFDRSEYLPLTDEIGNDEEINRLVDPEWDQEFMPGAPMKDDEIAAVNAPPRDYTLPNPFTDVVGDSRPTSPPQPLVVFRSEDEAASAVLRVLAAEVRALNQEKGWYDGERSFGDEMVNLHAEVSEAWEAYRARGFEEWEGKGGKPEGVGSELADVFIRLLDDCASHGFDLYAEYRRKMAYNATRPYRHGGKLR